jgi:hypothetical protein
VCLKHLPRTYLDGAALQLGDGTPVIGLTLRYDRLNNFWFCSLHELAHIGRRMESATCIHPAPTSNTYPWYDAMVSLKIASFCVLRSDEAVWLVYAL